MTNYRKVLKKKRQTIQKEVAFREMKADIQSRAWLESFEGKVYQDTTNVLEAIILSLSIRINRV